MPLKKKFDYQPNEKLAKTLESYRGKWVVIDRDEVLMSGDDLLELQREADARGIEYDLIDYVHDWKGNPPILIV